MEEKPNKELLDAMSNLARLQCRSLAVKVAKAVTNIEEGNYMSAACILADVQKDFAFATSVLSTAARITRTNG